MKNSNSKSLIGSPFRMLTIVESIRVNKRSILLTLNGNIHADPGQFVMVWLPNIGEKPYSLACANPVKLLIVDAGPFSHAAQGLKSREFIWLRGPYGKGFKLQGNKALLVAGGYGVAPLTFLADRAKEKDMVVEVCIGAKTKEDLLFEGDFKKHNEKVFITTENGSRGVKGLITDIVMQRLREFNPDGVYGCGPNAMLEKLDELGRQFHISTQLSWEARMRCGIGVCGSCERETHGKLTGWLVCQDGPVLNSVRKKQPGG